MKRLSLIVGIVSAAAVVLALSACAPAVKTPSTAGPARNNHTSSPTHAPSQAAIPSVRVPVKCSALLSDATVAPLIDGAVTYRRDESTPVIDITDITPRQYGSLDCLWGGPDREDSGYVEDLTVDLTPNAAAGFAANLSAFDSQDPPVTKNTAGDKSTYGCATDGSLSCVGNMLVGSYWVTAAIQDLGASGVAAADAGARIQKVLTATAAALTTAKAGPAWNPPGGALPGFCSATGSTAAVNTALGTSDFAVVGEDDQVADASSFTQTTGAYAQCTWQSAGSSGPFTNLSIAMLRGGAWVLPSLPGQSNTKAYMLGAYTSMTIPGATAAAGDCSVDADQCQVALSIGSVLVVINMDDPSDAQSTAALAKLVAAIKAS